MEVLRKYLFNNIILHLLQIKLFKILSNINYLCFTIAQCLIIQVTLIMDK